MAVVYGRLEIFDSRVESWTQYAERLDAYFKVNSITDNDKQRAILQTILDPNTYALLRNLLRPLTIPDKTYADLVTVLKQHFDPKPSKIVERFHFNNRNRKQGESVAIYVSELRKLSEHCSFGTNLNEMIRDRLVCGINDETMQRRLLTEDDTLTLEAATRIVHTMETATHNTQRIQNGENQSDTSANHVSNRDSEYEVATRRKPLRRADRSQSMPKFVPSARQCNRCTSKNHKSHECPFLEEACYKCEKIGHIAKACQSTAAEKPNKAYGVNSRLQSRTHHIDQDQPVARQYDFPVNNITTESTDPDTSTPPPDVITCQINGINMNFEVDTGSGHTMIREDEFCRIPNTGKLEQFKKSIRSYTGEAVDVLGTTTVLATFKSKEAELPVLVVRSQGPNLCGRKWLHSTLKILPSLNDFGVNHMSPTNMRLDTILKKHDHVFTPGLGRLKNVQTHLHIKPDAIPKYCKARTVPYSMTEKVEAELQRMEKEDIIESIPFSKYASPIVPVVKPNGSIRICGDFSSTSNPAINTEVYPLPRAQDIFSRLAGCKYFTKIDLKEAYNQIELDKESREITVINTSKGLYQYKRLPFGLSSSSAIFQRLMEMVVQDMDKVMPFQDDILLGAKTENDHLQQIDKFLTIIGTNGLKVRREKCHFFVSEVEFLGHRLDAEGLHPLNSKMEEIMQAPEPENVETLRSFLGMINYYGRFLPNHASNLAPLHKLLRKDTKWTWEKEQKDAFHQAKLAMKTSKMLVHYDMNKEVYLSCDASPYGLGGVISHMIEDSSGKLEERPISFASRSLTAAERNYSQLEREALAIIFSVTKFRDYLYGKKFTLTTDHQPLISLFSPEKPIPPMAAARIQRWALLLSAFQYEIKFRKGSANQNADALSRLPLPITTTKTPVPAEYVLLMQEVDRSPITSIKLEELTTQDPILSKVLRYMRQGFPTTKLDTDLEVYKRRQMELSNFDNLLFMGNRLIIPKSCQGDFLRELHNTHQGIVQMKSLARSRLWWPKIDQDIETTVKQCNICQENASMPAAKFQPWPEVHQPWERVHADFAGPIEGRYLLIIVDAYTKWMEVNITRSTSTEAVTTCLRDHIARFGIMRTLVTDNGSCFTSNEFHNFVTSNGITHLTSAPYHPQSNGQAERSVRIIKTGLKKLDGEITDEIKIVNAGLNQFHSGSLETRLARILLNYRRTPLISGKSPAELMLGRNIITRLDLCHPNFKSTSNIADEINKNTASRTNNPTTLKFTINDPVYLRNFGRGTKWKSGVIKRHIGKMMYEVTAENGNVRRHQNQLRPQLKSSSGDNNIAEIRPTTDPFNWMLKANETPDLVASPAIHPASVIPRTTRQSMQPSAVNADNLKPNHHSNRTLDPEPIDQQEEAMSAMSKQHPGRCEVPTPTILQEVNPMSRERPRRTCRPPERYTEMPNALYKS